MSARAKAPQRADHYVVYQDQYEMVCHCGVVLRCGGYLDSPARALGRHIRSCRDEATA